MTGAEAATRLRVGIHLPSSTDFAATIDDVVAYEAAGADIVWVGESYGYDAVSALGALAVRTSTMALALGVVPVQTRTASLLAMTAAGIDALSGGRAVLGLGASGPQVIEGWHEIDFGSPVQATRHVIERCRAIWRAERVGSERRQGDGSEYRSLKMIHRPIRPDIAIFVGALGPRSTQLTAEVADGWFAAFFWPERSREIWGISLAEGLRRRQPQLAPLEIAASAPLAIDQDTEAAMAAHRARMAHYVGGMGTAQVNFYNALTARYGFREAADQIRQRYLAGDRSGAEALLPPAMVEQTCLIGDRSTVAARLDAYQRAGVTILNVSPQGASTGERAAQVQRLAELVINRRARPHGTEGITGVKARSTSERSSPGDANGTIDT